MNDNKDQKAFDHAEADRSFLAVILSVINPIKRGAFKNPRGSFKPDSVLGDVALVLVFIPIEFRAASRITLPL